MLGLLVSTALVVALVVLNNRKSKEIARLRALVADEAEATLALQEAESRAVLVPVTKRVATQFVRAAESHGVLLHVETDPRTWKGDKDDVVISCWGVRSRTNGQTRLIAIATSEGTVYQTFFAQGVHQFRKGDTASPVLFQDGSLTSSFFDNLVEQ